ncbi:MAG: hypothetical protein Q9213_003140 [Squamulea squamosa]
MAPIDLSPAYYALRSVTRRLTSTPAAQLPYVAPSLACTLSTCGEILGIVDEQSQKKSHPEAFVLVHKIQTQISTLLQDRSKEARWAAVILVKATVEAGGWSILRDSDKWVRVLLGLIGVSKTEIASNDDDGTHAKLLQRPEPSTTKKLSIITLTRIFLMTQDHQSLVRELTTPSIPTFFTSCLRLVGDSKGNGSRHSVVNESILSTVLWSFGKLLPHHPSACRPFVGQLRTLVLPLIAPAPSSSLMDGGQSIIDDTLCSEMTAQRARHLFVLLSGCAAKNTQGQEWTQSMSMIIESSHRTADSVFRALLEDWEQIDQNGLKNDTGLVASSEKVGSHEVKSGLPDWKGLYGGLERLNGLLLTLQAHLTIPTAIPVNIPVGKIVNLVDRVLSALPACPNGSKAMGQGTRTNSEIGRDEREILWTGLPQLHVSAMHILEHLVLRLGEGSMAVNHQFLDAILWIFEHEHSHVQIRRTVYKLVSLLLPHCSREIPRTTALSLATCIRTCCEDLVSDPNGSVSSDGDPMAPKTDASKGSTSADAYSEAPGSPSSPPTGPTELKRTAERMLCIVLTHLPSGFLRPPIRSKIDQTAILAQNMLMLHSSVMSASIQHKGQQQSSLMPFLARQFPEDRGTEAVIRPCLPPVQHNIDEQTMDISLGVEPWAKVDEQGAWRSHTESDFSQETPHPMGIETEKLEQKTLGSDLPPIGVLPTEEQPAANPSLETEVQTAKSSIPAKRSLDLNPDGMHGISLDRPKGEVAPSAEPASKRLREGAANIYVAPATEDDLPPSTVKDPPEEPDAHSATLFTSSRLLANPHNINEDVAYEDSDESSIPPMDLTLATDDEEDDDDE